MVEKHINRLTEEEKKRQESDDEWSHITEGGPKLEIVDPLAVSARTIRFGKDQNYATTEEAVRDKSERFKDDISNTNQYLKFVNAHLSAKKSKIEKLKQDEKRFNEELESLQNFQVKPRADLDKLNYKKITEKDTESLLTHLQSEREILQAKIAHQQSQLEKAQQELEQKDSQISEVKSEIEMLNKKKASAPQTNPLEVIREELTRLGISDESARILGAVNSLEELIKSKAQT